MPVQTYKKYTSFHNKLVIIGFGSIGKGILPLIFRHIEIKPEQVMILTKKQEDEQIAADFGVKFVVNAMTRENYSALLNEYLQPGDFLLNLSVDVSSLALIEYCQAHEVLYLDTCIEPWEGGYVDSSLSSSERSCYAMREEVIALKNNQQKSTALVTHGANPGLVSHFVKQALLNIAADAHISVKLPETRDQWAMLANKLSIKVMHIAERDTQKTNELKKPDEFVNTWSIDGFVSEGSQPAEMGWGSHERHWPHDAYHHEFGSKCAIYLNRPGAATRVRTWTPHSGAFHAYLITHTESISISDYYTVKMNGAVLYRPTVHFAYHPCSDAVLSLNEFVGREWEQQPIQRVLYDEIKDGMDELGVLLMGHAKGAYWFGSQLTIKQARQLAPYNNATSLQVAIGALSGVIWAMTNPKRGVVEPDEVDHAFILEIAKPYLGDVVGQYTDWTPLRAREKLFPEQLDRTDPWQFLNVRVF